MESNTEFESLAEALERALTLAMRFDADAAEQRETRSSDRQIKPLSGHMAEPLDSLKGRKPTGERDAFRTLLQIYELWMAPLSTLGGREIFQSHPAVADLKWRLEAQFLQRLGREPYSSSPRTGSMHQSESATWPLTGRSGIDAVASIRRIAADDLVPEVYKWLAQEASWDQVVHFLTLEGGPDAGFDDLVALTQVGLHGDPKVVLGANYWDEMGRGDPAAVHTLLHDRLVRAIDMPQPSHDEFPVSGLERLALGGLLATNRSLQPEALGAFGLIELQAGPRCRAVIEAFRRLDAPEEAFAFYEEHARADPHHGKAWLDGVVGPLAEQDPRWAPRMIAGANWRHRVNRRFFSDVWKICSLR